MTLRRGNLEKAVDVLNTGHLDLMTGDRSGLKVSEYYDRGAFGMPDGMGSLAVFGSGSVIVHQGSISSIYIAGRPLHIVQFDGGDDHTYALDNLNKAPILVVERRHACDCRTNS